MKTKCRGLKPGQIVIFDFDGLNPRAHKVFSIVGQQVAIEMGDCLHVITLKRDEEIFAITPIGVA